MRLSTALLVAALLLPNLSTLARADEAKPVTIDSEAKVRDICLALRPVERVDFPGNASAQADARAEFEKRRDELKKTDYFIELPWSAFKIDDFDQKDGQIRISTERPFRAFKGAFTFFDADRDSVELETVEGAEDALKQGLAKGSLTLAFVFRPAEDEQVPCSVSKAPAYTFAVDLVAAELRLEGKAVAKAKDEGMQPMAAASGEPSVEITTSGDDAGSKDLVASVEKARPALLACYAKGLARKPDLDGSLVLALEPGKDGKLLAKTVIADSVSDTEVTSCVTGALAKVPAPQKSPGRIAIHLERKTDAAPKK